MGKQKVTSSIDRERIINAYLNKQNHIQLASQLGICKRTAQRILQAYNEEGRKSPKALGLKKNITNEMTEDIKKCIDENSTITLQEIQHKLLQKYNKNISLTTVHNTIKHENIKSSLF